MKKYLYLILCSIFINVSFSLDEEIIVTSSLGGATLAEIDSPIFVIKGEDINYSGTTSLGGNLKYLLGVNSSDFGAAVGQPIIRGMSGTRVRILSNGKLVRDVSGLGSDHLNDVDLNDIQQVEVVRGPSSLLYSNGTMGGIINIVDQTIASKDFEGNDFNIGLEAQSVNSGTSGSFSYKGNINDVNLTYALKEIHFESYDVPMNSIIHEGSPEAEENLKNSDYATLSHKLGTSIVRDWGYFGFSVADIENTYGIAFHEEEEPAPGAPVEEHDDRIQVDTSSTNLTIEGASNNISALDKLSYFLQINDYDFTEGHIGGEHNGESTTFTNESYEIGMKFDIGDQTSGNRQNVTLNLSEEDVSITPSDANEDPFMRPTESQMLSIGYFICRELDVMDVDFGVRMDRVSRDGSIKTGNTVALYDVSETDLSAALTMGWNLANNLGLTLGVSSVARAPSELELFMNGTHLAAGRDEFGNQNLESERSNNVDFSISYENDGYFVNTSLYTNSVDNYIYLLDSGQSNRAEANKVDYDYVQADANFHGYELEIGRSFIFNNSELLVSYGRDQVVGTFSDGGNVPRITPVKDVYRLAISQDNVTYDFKISDVQREDDLGFGETVTKGFTMVDFDLRRSISIGNEEELILSIFGRNLLDAKARSHTSYVKDEVPMPGRNFGIKLNFNF